MRQRNLPTLILTLAAVLQVLDVRRLPQTRRDFRYGPSYRFRRKPRRWLRPAAALSVTKAKSNSNGAATATTVTLSTAAGALLVIIAGQNVNNTSTLAITDTSGANSWAQTTSGYSSANSTSRAAMFFAANAAAVTTVTATWSGGISGTVNATLYEIAGAATSSPEDASVNSNSNVGATSATSGALTTTNAADILIYGIILGGGASGLTAGAGYTIPTNGSNARGGMEYNIVSATQSAVTTSVTWTGSTTHAAVFAAFKAPAVTVDGKNLDLTLRNTYS